MALRDSAAPAGEPVYGRVHPAQRQGDEELVDVTAAAPALDAPGAGIGVRDELTARAEAYARGARAGSTWSAYERQWARFESWCRDAGERALPAEPLTVVRFLAALAPVWRPAVPTDSAGMVVAGQVRERDGMRPGTLAGYLAAI